MRATLIAGALLLCLAGPVSAADQVPFSGFLQGTVTVTPLEPPLASVDIDASGVAGRLGRFALDIPHVVNQATRLANGTYAFTAANGDTLTASFSGEATLVAPGVLSIVETATITGGTGRFEGASGWFTTDRTFTIATGQTTGTFSGWISPPGR